jgi:transglutaminase-like putative cysteine protease
MRQKMAQIMDNPKWVESSLPTNQSQNKALWGMVQKFTGHPLFVHFLATLIREYGVEARDPEALARAIQDYSVKYIKFFRERPERFQSPMRTIVWGLGDCDDKTILIASALRTFRIPTRLVILRMKIDGRNVGHVYPEAEIAGKWVPLESVRAYPWGHDPSAIAKRRGFLVSKEIVGDKAETGAYA